MKNRMIATESFRSGKDIYFFDYLEAVNGRHYLRIARMENCPGGPTKRTKVVIFEDVIQPMISAFAYLFHAVRYDHEQDKTVQDVQREAAELEALKAAIDPEMPLRERMSMFGAASLTNQELLAVLLGLGSVGKDAGHMSSDLLEHIGGNIARLINMMQADLCRMPGIGMAKSCMVLAAMELGRRSFEAAPITGSPADIRYSPN
jgi:DNA repair protein RadC